MEDPVPDPECPGCQALLRRVAKLEATVERLEARLGQNSSNSGRPPSSDPPGKHGQRKKSSNGRRRGGQPGHEKSSRPLLPPDQVDELHCVKPSACSECGERLCGEDANPWRHQTTEIPPVRPIVTEYQLHALQCHSCGQVTRAELPKGTPSGAFGPRLEALVVLLSGTFRLSRRNVQALLVDGFGVDVSLGMISKIEQQMSALLALPHQSALVEFHRQPVAHADETGWKEAGERSWLWAGVSGTVSVFLIRSSRGTQAAKELIGEESRATCITDRWSAYEWVDLERRQLCWSHLIRDFQKIVDRGGESRVIGERLLIETETLFHEWHLLRDGEISRRQLKRRTGKVRKRVRALLEIGTASTVFGVGGLCRGILELESAMWTFVDRPGVEPTNNAAERLIRPAVLWRKTSFGTQSPAGSRFAERILTCVATLRQQGRNVLEYLTALRKAALSGAPAPPLIG